MILKLGEEPATRGYMGRSFIENVADMRGQWNRTQQMLGENAFTIGHIGFGESMARRR